MNKNNIDDEELFLSIAFGLPLSIMGSLIILIFVGIIDAAFSKRAYYVCDCEQQQELHKAVSGYEFYKHSGRSEVLTEKAKFELNTICNQHNLPYKQRDKLKEDSCKFLYSAQFGELRK